MHRCLEVYDIVLVVVEFLNFLDHAHPNEPCNLLSFGLSCRHLFDPAMDILWSTQEDLYNLVKCMPSDLWQVTTSNDSEGNLRSMMSFVRSSHFWDWERPEVYAKRIQHLRCVASKQRELSPEIMEAFILFSHAKSSLQGHHSPILPKLQSLQWTWRDDQDKFTTQIGTILSGPNLLRLTFAAQRAETDTHPTQSFECTVLSLASVAPNLQQVVLSFSSDPSTTITDAVSRFLNRLPNLRLFECRSPLPSETLLSLARCPYLHDLDIRLSRNLKDYALTSSPTSNFFPNIQNVHIRAKEVRRAILFLDNLQSQFVKRVNITTSARTLLLSEVGNYFKCLASRGSLEKIIFQKFSGSSGQSSPRDTSVMRFGTFAPLLKLRNITILAVSSGFAIDLDDECIKRFSEAWPKLYRLSILSERPLPTSPKITLESFLILLQNCPNIYTIGLTLGSCTPTSTNWDLLAALQLSKPDLGINVHQITVRNCSRVEDWEVVGDFIHSMFPTCHVSVDDTKMDDYEEMQRISSWEEVKRHVRRGRQDRRARLETVRTSESPPQVPRLP